MLLLINSSTNLCLKSISFYLLIQAWRGNIWRQQGGQTQVAPTVLLGHMQTPGARVSLIPLGLNKQKLVERRSALKGKAFMLHRPFPGAVFGCSQLFLYFSPDQAISFRNVSHLSIFRCMHELRCGNVPSERWASRLLFVRLW